MWSPLPNRKKKPTFIEHFFESDITPGTFHPSSKIQGQGVDIPIPILLMKKLRLRSGLPMTISLVVPALGLNPALFPVFPSSRANLY